MQEEIEDRVRQAIANAAHVSVDDVTLDKTFEEVGLTSLDALAIVADLEEEFGIEISNEDALSLRDVRQAVECVRVLTASGAEQS